MKKTIELFPIFALFLTPFIAYQWHMKLIRLRLDVSTNIFSYLYLISILYVLAYLLIYKKKLIGYFVMWIVFIVLMFAVLRYQSYYLKQIFISIDLWVNLVLTIFGVINYNKQVDK